MEPIATKKIGKKILKLFQDSDASNPREDCTPMGKILYTSARYMLGDKQVPSEVIDDIVEKAYVPGAVGEVEKLLGIGDKEFLVLRTYAYIHGSTTLTTSRTGNPFHCRFDSGCCGIIYMSLDDVKKEYGDLSPESIEKALKYMEGEVKVFNQWLNGECYGYKLEDKNGEELDSCWGYVGDQDEILKMLAKELKK